MMQLVTPLLVVTVALQVGQISCTPLQSRFGGQTRIAGGSVAYKGQFPYHVGLIMDNSVFCGGVLIKADWVLTTAHCVKGSKSIVVHLGARQIFELDHEKDLRKILLGKKPLIHEKYNEANLEYNLALVGLNETVPFTETIKPIDLPLMEDANANYTDHVATVTGWGFREGELGVAYWLSFTNVKIVNNTICEKVYSSKFVNAGTLCTETSSGRGACLGDDGGPLVSVDTPKHLLGVLSSVGECGNKHHPAIFIRIGKYISWISQNINRPNTNAVQA